MSVSPKRTEPPAGAAQPKPHATGRPSVWASWLPHALLLLVIWIIPTFVCRPSAEGKNYGLAVLILVGINTILAVGLNLLMGYAGQVSLGHAAFYGIGAYVSAILTTQMVPQETMAPLAAAIAVMAATAGAMALLRAEGNRLLLAAVGFALPAGLLLYLGPRHPVPYGVAALGCALLSRFARLSWGRLLAAWACGAATGGAALALFRYVSAASGLSPWAAIPIGAAFACLVAYLIGAQALRLKGHYLAMATLGFGSIVNILFREWEPLTGGTSGIYGIPTLAIGGITFDKDTHMYYLVWGIVAVVIALSANIIHSRVGRAFRAVHGSEVAASSLGVDTERYKLQVFMLSAVLASVAGSLYAHYVTFISPQPFGFHFSVELMVMVVVGGMASVWGAIFGAGAVTLLGEALRGLGEATVPLLGCRWSDMDVVVFGLILMVIMIYLPAGLTRAAVDSARLALRAGGWRRKKR